MAPGSRSKTFRTACAWAIIAISFEHWSPGLGVPHQATRPPYRVAPIFDTLLLNSFATQMLVPSKATPRGALPTAYVPSTAPVPASNLVTVLSPSFTTQIFVPSKATPIGELPTPPYVSTTAPVLARRSPER